jgi:Dyp-type peroxidase family
MPPSLTNVQGLIVHGYTHPYSRHLLLKITDAAAGRALLKALHPLVTSATDWSHAKPSTLLNLGISYNGLNALKVNSTIVEGQDGYLNGFPLEFKKSGEGNPDQRTGFTGTSDPSHWWPHATTAFTTSEIHLTLHLYALTPESLDSFTAQVRALFSPQITELCPQSGGGSLDGFLPEDRKVHFGYKDGISQPNVNWEEDNPGEGSVNFREFLLGYANNEHPSAPPGEFVQDGSYLAFQVIYQNCAYFNQFIRMQAERITAPPGVTDIPEWVAAKLVGRWRSGAPLVATPLVDDPSKTDENEFVYAADQHGHSCPFSAHIRVCNPRDQVIDEHVKPVPRLLRRGAPYGPRLVGETDDGVDRGLIGLFICASLDRQYLKLMKWINRNDFSPVYADQTAQDPLQGNRDIAGALPKFHLPMSAGDQVIDGLKSFVHTKGAAFCFLPSLSTIQKLGAGAYS